MSKEIEVVWRDDFDKTQEADFTIAFGWGLDIYEVDVTEARRKEMEALAGSWIEVARKIDFPHLPMSTHGDRDREEAKLRKHEQGIRIYRWAMSFDEWAEELNKKKAKLSPNAVPYLSRPIRNAYFAEHPDETEIK